MTKDVSRPVSSNPLWHPVSRIFFGAVAGMLYAIVIYAWPGRGDSARSEDTSRLVADPGKPFLWLMLGGTAAGAVYGFLLPRAKSPGLGFLIGLLASQPFALGALRANTVLFPETSRLIIWLVSSVVTAFLLGMISGALSLGGSDED